MKASRSTSDMKASNNSDTRALAKGFPAITTPDARILILGSMPGQRSLREQTYYAHPRNAFWPIMGRLFDFPSDAPYALRVARLRAHGIALWDVLQSCHRPGSLDADIAPESIVCNDLHAFLSKYSGITRICCNGAAAYQLFCRHARPTLANVGQHELLRLPSTSPAHASLTLEKKFQAWQAALLG